MRRVVLLTDFGTGDGYAAAMAGMVVSASPDCIIEHSTHEVAPGDVLGAALTLSRYAHLYPLGTVHLVVVDPGVGSSRRAMAATIAGRHFVAPDNGVLTLAFRQAPDFRAVALDQSGAASSTFHGRDVFAPAAGRLAAGESVSALGAAIHDPILLEIPEPVRQEGGVRGEVLEVDRFGNVITNIPGDWLDATGEVRLGPHVVGPLRRTYADVGGGEALALVGSLGLLEISVRNGSAAVRFSTGRGAPVYVDSRA